MKKYFRSKLVMYSKDDNGKYCIRSKDLLSLLNLDMYSRNDVEEELLMEVDDILDNLPTYIFSEDCISRLICMTKMHYKYELIDWLFYEFNLKLEYVHEFLCRDSLKTIITTFIQTGMEVSCITEHRVNCYIPRINLIVEPYITVNCDIKRELKLRESFPGVMFYRYNYMYFDEIEQIGKLFALTIKLLDK